MKKILSGLLLLLTGTFVNAQNGLENIIVEKYYVSNAGDAAGSIGILPVGSVTYRVYADMLPGYKFQAAYGVPGHTLNISTSTTFFNNEDRGATTPGYSKNNAADNTVMLDSWLSVGAGCSGNFGIMKTEDNGVANVVNSNGILQNNDPSAGIPITMQDGLYAGAPLPVTFVGISSADLAALDATSQAGSIFTTSNGSWAALGGTLGPVAATNRVLIAQLTTTGCLYLELNIQIGTPTGGVQNYVAKNPVGNEILFPPLIYNGAAVANISADPSGQVCSGTSVTYTALASSGTGTPTYQWKKNNVNVGTNSPTYTATPANNDQIKCVVTIPGSCVTGSPVTSNSLTMVVIAKPAATITPLGPTTFCSGGNVVIQANTGTGLTYQWKKSGVVINGATGASYAATSNGTYNVVVSNASGCTKQSTAGVAVTVNALPSASITTQGPTTFCAGATPLTLTANAGTGLSYQWLKTNVDIAGATANNYLPTATGTYKVNVTNSNGCTKSSSGVTVTVNALPSATITAQGALTFCAGDSVKLTANSGTGFTYQWVKGINNIAGATAQNYIAKTAGTYKVTVTKTNGCSKLSSGKTVTVNCREGEDMITADETRFIIYPNPFKGSATIELNLSQPDDIAVEIMNMQGQVLTRIPSGHFESGKSTIDLSADGMAAGLYIARIIKNGTASDHIRFSVME
jgi:hypothetical protein